MSITPLPSAPQPIDSTSEFNTKAFAWVAALDTWTTEANALGEQVSDDADAAAASATDAENSAVIAAGAAAALNAEIWVSGTTYAVGDVVYSGVDFQTYRRKTNGAGTTDPSSDSTNWQVISGDASTTATQTFTNKTLTAPVINQPVTTGGKETKVAIAASDIDLTLGNYYTITISATTTFTVSNVPTSGTVASFILDLTNGGSQTINWFSGVDWAGGTAPVLTTSGRDVLGFFTHDGGTTWAGLLLGKDVK